MVVASVVGNSFLTLALIMCSCMDWSIALLLEESQRWSEKRNLDLVIQLPYVAMMIMEKVEEARLHEQARVISVASKPRKSSNTTSKSVVPQYRIKFSQEKRSPFIQCPNATCLHLMLMPLNSVSEVEEINLKQHHEYQAAIAQWIRGGKKGSRPSKKKPMSLLLGCFCCTQNCLNRHRAWDAWRAKKLGGPPP
jgi:hypothetical protein